MIKLNKEKVKGRLKIIMSDKEKVAFISHSFHKKTKSVEFLINYLKEYFEVETVYNEEWETGKKIQWEKFDNQYKAVIILQMFPTKEDFEKIPNRNIIFFADFLLCSVV